MKLNMKKALLITIVMTFMIGLNVNAKNVSDYEDVYENDWFYRYVEAVSKKEWMTGIDEITFAPNANLARAQLATIIYRMQGSPATSYSPVYNDVTDGYFYSVSITWASRFGVITGYQDGSGNFGPADNINREQLATMLYRYASKLGYDMSASKSEDSFPDGGSVTEYAREAIRWCLGVGIITGDNGHINPQGTVNRAVAATMISRFTDFAAGGNDIDDDTPDGHVHVWEVISWENIKNGYACNECLNDVTDWEDKYACHGGWHTHTWYFTPYTETCSVCNAKRHLHEWTWVEPEYYTGTSDVMIEGYWHCWRCGNKSTDGINIEQELREKYWVSGFDFTNSGYILGVKSTEAKPDSIALQRIDIRPVGIGENLSIGDTGTLEVLYTPSNTSTKEIKWKSSNSSVVKVDSSGGITAVGVGTATITAESISDSSCTDSYTFTVTATKEGAVSDAWLVIDGQKVANNGTFVCSEGMWSAGVKQPVRHSVYVMTDPSPARYSVKYNAFTNEQFASDSPDNYYVVAMIGPTERGNSNNYTNPEDTKCDFVVLDAGTADFSVVVTDAYNKKITFNVKIKVE